jgi:superfamily I DNA and/or RNA helicase
LELSFGIWIFKFAGIIFSLLSEPDEHRVFYNYFDQYSRNEEFIKKDIIAFREKAKALRFQILEAADAIVITLFNAGDASLTNNCTFDVVVIDEISKCIESDTWNVLDYYAAETYLLAGDHK